MLGALNDMLQNNLSLILVVAIAAFALAGWNFYNLNKPKTESKPPVKPKKNKPVKEELEPPSPDPSSTQKKD